MVVHGSVLLKMVVYGYCYMVYASTQHADVYCFVFYSYTQVTTALQECSAAK